MALQQVTSYIDNKHLRLMNVVLSLSAILYFGREIFIPLAFALLISFVAHPVCAWMERKGMGRSAAIVVALVLLLLIALGIAFLLVNQFVAFINEWPAFENKLTSTVNDLSLFLENSFGVSQEQQAGWLSRLSNESGSHLLKLFRDAVSFSAMSAVMLILVPVYAFLILYYRKYWMLVLYKLFPSESTESLRDLVLKTVTTYYKFIKGMAIVYFAVGALNSIGLLIIGVPHAILFGFITSILTFIPYVGILVGSLLPITLAWVTYDSIWYPISIIGVFTFVQYLEANIIFPVAVSSRLNVNTLAMLVSIFAGAILWGVSGMILFVPFVGILKLVADHHPKWKVVSLLLGTPAD